MITNTCGACDRFNPDGDGAAGYCHRSPPVVVTVPFQGRDAIEAARGVWYPAVLAAAPGCAEFLAAPAPADPAPVKTRGKKVVPPSEDPSA